MGSRTNGDPVIAAKRDFMRSALAALTSALLLSAFALVPQAAAAQGGGPAKTHEISFVALGDTGYIPAYDTPDDDDPRFRTLGEYLGYEAGRVTAGIMNPIRRLQLPSCDRNASTAR